MSQVIRPHTLKLYNAVYQLYLNRTGGGHFIQRLSISKIYRVIWKKALACYNILHTLIYNDIHSSIVAHNMPDIMLALEGYNGGQTLTLAITV